MLHGTIIPARIENSCLPRIAQRPQTAEIVLLRADKRQALCH
jgi:hypothetical protein